LDNLSGGFRDYIPNGVKFVEGLGRGHRARETILRKTIRIRFSTSPRMPRGLEPFHQALQLHDNLLASVNLINASVKPRREMFCVFTSSIAVYGANQLR